MGSYHNVLALSPHNKTVWLKERIIIFLMLFELFYESRVLSHFWCEALCTAVYLINRLPSPNLNNDSPYFCLFGLAPNYSNLHIFGCTCFVHLPAHERNKLTAQFVKCAFLGYAGTQKGFLCYDPHARRTRVSRNVIFF
jgi:hypothetical protein